jgi:hypothetical protein
MVVPMPPRQDLGPVARQELGEGRAVERGGVEEGGVEDVGEGVERRVVRDEDGVRGCGVGDEAAALEEAAVEEGLEEARVGAVPGVAAGVGARAEAVVSERLAGRGGGGRRGWVGEREGGVAVAEELRVEARGEGTDVDPASRAWVWRVSGGVPGVAGNGAEDDEEEEQEGIGHLAGVGE